MENKAKTNRIGETRMMNCGLSATIIAYRGYKDIDIQFEDSTIIKHRKYGDFKNGSIANPITKIKKNYIGETRMMNCGMEATIVAYRNNVNIDLKFSNGEKRINARYGNFVKGNVVPPSLMCTKPSLEELNSRVGTKILQNCGKIGICVAYRKNYDIDVQFEDGSLAEHRTWQSFCQGKVATDSTYTLSIKGKVPSKNEFAMQETLKSLGFTKSKCGEIPELEGKELDAYCSDFFGYKVGIEYDGGFWHKQDRDSKKDVLCSEAGIILFRLRENPLPLLKTSNCIRVNSSASFLDDAFFDAINSLIKELNKLSGSNFKIDIPSKEEIIKLYYKQYSNSKPKKLNETRVMNCGMKATIIAYRNSRDIDVQFEDGTIVQHRTVSDFNVGGIANPITNVKKNRVEETRIMNCGLKATIVAYRNYSDIDIQFEDGTIVEHRNYGSFKNGQITYKPSLPIIQTAPLTIEEELTPILNFEEEKQVEMESDVFDVIKSEEDRTM